MVIIRTDLPVDDYSINDVVERLSSLQCDVRDDLRGYAIELERYVDERIQDKFKFVPVGQFCSGDNSLLSFGQSPLFLGERIALNYEREKAEEKELFMYAAFHANCVRCS